MKVFPSGLRRDIQSLENSLSLLVTITNPTLKWSGLPRSELKILEERVSLMNETLDEIYTRLNKYEVA
jgi:hypothetical protein